MFTIEKLRCQAKAVSVKHDHCQKDCIKMHLQFTNRWEKLSSASSGHVRRGHPIFMLVELKHVTVIMLLCVLYSLSVPTHILAA